MKKVRVQYLRYDSPREPVMPDNTERNLLIIDDDPAIRTVVRMQLKNTAIRLHEASDIKGTMKALKDQPIDAVICDIKLKNLSGFEVFREIRKIYPDMPVIMLTGYIEQEYYDTSLEMGAADLIIKPVRKEKLLESLGKIFDSA